MRIYKRGNIWWRDYYQDGQRFREALPKSISSKDQAQAWIDELEKREKSLELRHAINEYLTFSRTRLASSSLTRYRFTLSSFENHFGLNRRVDGITGKDINAWASMRLQKGLSPETVNIDLRHIKAFFRRLAEWEMILKPPRIEMVKAPKRLPRHLSDEQVQAILSAEPSEKFRLLFTFLWWTGVRRAEAVNLTWEDITIGDHPQARIIGKGDRQRVIPLLPPAVDAMGEIKASGPVFTVGSAAYVTQRFNHAAKRAGVRARLHDLRHTCLTNLVGRKLPLKLVQDIAGHSDIKTTLNYAKTFIGDAYGSMAKAFGFDP